MDLFFAKLLTIDYLIHSSKLRPQILKVSILIFSINICFNLSNLSEVKETSRPNMSGDFNTFDSLIKSFTIMKTRTYATIHVIVMRLL